MAKEKKVIAPNIDKTISGISNKVRVTDEIKNLTVSFSMFQLEPVSINGKFNNHFKDEQQFNNIVANFLGIVLPKITSHTYKEICEGTYEGRILHFHTIDDEHRRMVREVLKEYHFADYKIDQMFEGNNIFECVASLGHINAARIVCHKVDDTLYPLFWDTNHHIYFNEKYVRESLFYEHCPQYLNEECLYMPVDCFAVSYLDEERYKESFAYDCKIY